MLAEPAMFYNVKKGDIIQIQRKAFYICDQKTDATLVLVEIPDGKEKEKKKEPVIKMTFIRRSITHS